MDLFQIIDLGIIISIGITALFIITLFLAKRKSTKERRADLALLSIASFLHIVQLLIMLSGLFDSGGLNFYLSAAVNISGISIGLFTFYQRSSNLTLCWAYILLLSNTGVLLLQIYVHSLPE